MIRFTPGTLQSMHWIRSLLLRRSCLVSPLVALCVILQSTRGEDFASGAKSSDLAAKLGRKIFLDTNLSQPRGQGCVSCHQPSAAFADPRQVSSGAVSSREGRRNSPTLMYAALIPGFAYEETFTPDGDEVYAFEGGLFHDGRARDLFEQVQKPFFDPTEMNLSDEGMLASRIRSSAYATDFRAWIGNDRWSDDTQVSYHVYRALVEFLKEPFFRPFDARIDDYLDGDEDALSESEKRGLDVFRGVGKCADCHFLTPNSWPQPLLSDFGYDNLGVPSRGARDAGLGERLGLDELGKFKAPTLRNIAVTAPYMHNGSIATLSEVMQFYNRRDLEANRWGPTDYPQTVNREDMGDLKLTSQQVNDLVALMQAFTDRSLLQPRDGDGFPKAPHGTSTTESRRLYFPDWTHRMHPAYATSKDVLDSPSSNRDQ